MKTNDTRKQEFPGDLSEYLGEPLEPKGQAAGISHWVAESAPKDNGFLFEKGDGILVARTASDEHRSHQVAMEQIGKLITLSRKEDLMPREIIVLTGQSGLADFADRWDLLRIQEQIEEGAINWVAYCDIDRVGKSIPVLERFISLLDDTGTSLFLGSDDGKLSEETRGMIRTLKALTAD